MSTSATNKKVIAITGASSGIGEETAKQLVDNGFNVALLARSEDKLRALVEELGNDNAFAVKADVSDFNELDKAFKQVSEHFGRIDGIFANAGRGAKAAGIEKGDVDDWDGMLGANVNGLLYTAKAGLPYLRDTQGHFIITSSVAGRIALKGSVYGASKWFAYGFGQNLAEEMREWGGRCTTICPGMVNTPFFDEPKEDKLQPADIAKSVLFALSAEESACVREVYVMPAK
ncbi:MAG: SDR family oxidoreductase [Alteromonas macleodii]|uniref:SDR family oxidoreductase n=1 Tax=Alteromonas TaxID=226 RepID=UPI00127DC076|nr:SDR family oxidoreductase [Alteromonas macleodii]MCG8498115.1 SDR family oxidoreductase [Enterobacterales bacterium]MDM7963311.1 SDR family oxidoreductase [Alteromonas macleodii]MDM8171836.1 SDR family oxidoreductase [Alteromonas macleodii]CAI3964431.1 NADP-dependent 3-hydroxy acid dehydrogenase YdfG [Alteromonas macleodii]VTP56844.1 NADP-dependent 3-hydroxy acid dehydrogenase YdfG [Alteromonas macleodii]|tara:strand:- start:326 stop:1018 length:693 start_codon:yes stop_codon:yes gene_type:complete